MYQNITNIKSSPINRDFEYLEISQISLSNFEYQTTTVKLGEEPDRAHHLLKRGDVVVSTVRPNRNAIAFIKTDGIVGSSGLAVLRTNNIEAEYLLAFCKTSYFVNCLMRANKASMYPAVSTGDILDTPLFVPSKSLRLLVVETVKNAIVLALEKSKTDLCRSPNPSPRRTRSRRLATKAAVNLRQKLFRHQARRTH